MTDKKILTRIKHLRGRHNQLDHAWNRGMGRGGGGADLASNQMGPLPTQQFYRQQYAKLMEQRRSGQITREEMRSQMRNLRGIVETQPNNRLTLANELKPEIDISELVDRVQKERARDRLTYNIDISPYINPNMRVSDGASGVLEVTLPDSLLANPDQQGKKFYYRRTPIYGGSYRGQYKFDESFVDSRNGQSNAEALEKNFWFPMPSFYMPLVADALSSSMGLNIAPVATITSQGRVLVNPLPPSRPGGNAPALLIQELQRAYEENPTQENFERYINTIESFIVMSLLTGNVDIKPENLWIVKNESGLIDSDELITTVDYDYTGGNSSVTGPYQQEEPILQNYMKMILKRGETRLLTPTMRAILQRISDEGITPTSNYAQTNENEESTIIRPGVPPIVNEMMIERIRVLLDLDDRFSQISQSFQENLRFVSEDAATGAAVREITNGLFNISMNALSFFKLLKPMRRKAINAQIIANMVQRAIVTGRISNPELGDEIQKQLIALSRKLIEEQMVAPDESSNSLNDIFNQIDSLINQANDLMFSQ